MVIGMAKQKPKPLEAEPVFDRTVQREMFRTDLSAAVTKATTLCGLTRVQVISDLLHFADELCAIAAEEGDDLSSLQGLLTA
jgi:hypothetical protein